MLNGGHDFFDHHHIDDLAFKPDQMAFAVMFAAHDNAVGQMHFIGTFHPRPRRFDQLTCWRALDQGDREWLQQLPFSLRIRPLPCRQRRAHFACETRPQRTDQLEPLPFV